MPILTATTPPRPRRPRHPRLRVVALAAVPALLAAGAVVAVASSGDAATVTANGVRLSGAVSPATAAAGTAVRLSTTVRSTVSRTVVVDVEVAAPDGSRARQRFWTAQSLVAGTPRTFTTTWSLPAAAKAGGYRLRVGVFTAGWGRLLAWNDDAARLTVTTGTSPSATATTTPTTPTTTPTATPTAAPTPTSTATSGPSGTASGTSSSGPSATPTTTPTATPTPTASAPPTAGVPARFGLVPPGGALPSGAQCAAWVRGVPTPPEVKGDNASANSAPGSAMPGATGLQARVDGAFTGTTEQVLRWAACKWGQDEDVVKAQAAVESWWHMSTKGDWGTDPGRCPPGHGLGVDGTAASCPESWGLLQIRYPYNVPAFPDAMRSSAFNADYAYAAWRSCYTGELTWLNTVERGSEYAAGDAWGCTGVWFSGRWHTTAAEGYIAKVRSYLDQRIWTGADFAQP